MLHGSLEGFAFLPLRGSFGAGFGTLDGYLFEVDVIGSFEYGGADFRDNMIGFDLTGKAFRLRRTGTLDEWLAKVDGGGKYYPNRNLVSLDASLRVGRIKGSNGQYTDDYILQGGTTLDYALTGGSGSMTGQGEVTLTIPPLESNHEWWCLDCPLRDLYNSQVGGKQVSVSAEFRDRLVSGTADFSSIAPAIGVVPFALHMDNGQIEIGQISLTLVKASRKDVRRRRFHRYGEPVGACSDARDRG
jgi:hypothetical protein